jgi:hypothetical protein
MKGVMCAVAAALFAGAAAGFPDEKPEIRELNAKGLNLAESKLVDGAPKAVEIKSAAELAKSAAFADDESRDAIKKQVNFDREKLVVLAWAGSGQDRLVPKVILKDKKVTAYFGYKIGFTDDLRRHRHVFAVPKDAAVKSEPLR